MNRYEDAFDGSDELPKLTDRELLEWAASFSPRAEAELRQLEWEEAEAKEEALRERELLEFVAAITGKPEHERELRALMRKEAEERESQERSGWLAEGKWIEADHLREPKGTPEGGEWASKGGGGSREAPAAASGAGFIHTAAYRTEQSSVKLVAGGGPSGSGAERPKSSASATTGAAPVPVVTKQQLPADSRGTWVSGTKGNGVFRYNDSPENRNANLAGKEFRFGGDHIAAGTLPHEDYYGGGANAASVDIPKVTGLESDNLAADAAMRKKIGDANWRRPGGYVWHHAGEPESTRMELVREGVHGAVSHKGPAALPRAIRRLARRGGGATSGAMGALTAYMTARDALQAAGVLKPDYDEYEHMTYHFIDKDGSEFIVVPGGWFSSAKREFIDGPRKGQSETITADEMEAYRQMAEDEWGKYVPGSLLKDPRFIPGRKRKTLPLMIDKYGVPHEGGWIDENGIHLYSEPHPAVI